MASRTPPSDALGAWIAGQRWFAAKTRRITHVDVEDRLPLADASLVIVRIGLDDGSEDRYAVPLAPGPGTVDALDGSGYAAALFALIGAAGRISGERGTIAGVPTRAWPGGTAAGLPARRLEAEQSNTSVVLGHVAILKHFRRLAPGPNPEQEITRFLTERTAFAHAPRLYGHVEYLGPAGPATLAVAHELITGAEDGWTWILGQLRRLYAGPDVAGTPAAEESLAAMDHLGEITAALHVALASDARDPDFAPEAIVATDVARWAEAIRRQVDEASAALGDGAGDAPDVSDGLRALLGSAKVRHHGDFHLGQTLYRPARADWVVIDFEGEPLRPMAERRQKHTALRDVAGMLRSIDYAAASAAARGDDGRARAWERAAAIRFVGGYRRRAAGASFVPATEEAFARAVAAFVVEKAAYEIVYEANHRPDWVRIPAAGLRRAVATLSA